MLQYTTLALFVRGVICIATRKAIKARGSRLQRKVAEFTGGRNVGILGEEDVTAGPFAIECKERERIAVFKFMDQAENNRRGLVPIVWMHINGKSHDSDLIMVRWKELKKVWKRFMKLFKV